jgi:glutathione S-transferase
MGQGGSVPEREQPHSKTDATLYYFPGRGMADQIRWMLAYTEVSFTQRIINKRERFLNLVENGQLAFGKLPLLQIDGQELVESQAIIRYLAKRGNLVGKTATDEVYCDMIACNIIDVVSPLLRAPFTRAQGEEAEAKHKEVLKASWIKGGTRLEMCIERNKKKGKGAFLVGDCVTYVDVLLAHCVTWYAEECGSEILEDFPYCLAVQHAILSNSETGMRKFLSGNQWYPLGSTEYAAVVSEVLNKPELIRK